MRDRVRREYAILRQRHVRCVQSWDYAVLRRGRADMRCDGSVGQRGRMRATPDVHRDRWLGGLFLQFVTLHAEWHDLSGWRDRSDVRRRLDQVPVR